MLRDTRRRAWRLINLFARSDTERAEGGLSLATLARLSSGLGLTIDDLLHGEDPDGLPDRSPDR
ncbi:MAG: hypothetical protein ACLPTJ_13085 [Solirubrobacteraceae bacterium]